MIAVPCHDGIVCAEYMPYQPMKCVRACRLSTGVHLLDPTVAVGQANAQARAQAAARAGNLDDKSVGY